MSDVHRPVLLEETVALVSGADEVREGTYVDATFGRGGHSRKLLERLGAGSRVVAVDQDPDAVAAGRALARDEPRLLVVHGNFAELDTILDRLGIRDVQGIMMDLGVSSPQLDDPQRGFSFRYDAPLDMRMDTSRGITAAEWLNTADQDAIAAALREYGEERYARRIAAAIVAARPLHTTAQLVDTVRSAQPRSTPGKHPATRVFQAVRMAVNRELDVLSAGLEVAFERLAPGGRLAVISFHSLEDRVVKRFFSARCRPPPLPRRLPVRGEAGAAQARQVGRARTPGEREIAANPRARSARLRVLERVLEKAA